MNQEISSWKAFYPGYKGYPGEDVGSLPGGSCPLLVSRSAILPAPTRKVGRNQGPVPPEWAKTGGRGLGLMSGLVSEEGRGGVRDFVWQVVGVPQEVGRDHCLVLAPRRNRALIPRAEALSHQLIGRSPVFYRTGGFCARAFLSGSSLP
jgi:hypothetical protein